MSDLNDQFEEWLSNKKKNDGSNYSPKTIANYIWSLQKDVSKLSDVQFDNSNLFYVNNIEVFSEMKKQIEASADFEKVKASQNNTFSSALDMYKEFLNEIETKDSFEDTLNNLLDEYKKDFASRWKNESFKWKAAKCFQDNWNIDSPNFLEMFEKATKDTDTLLVNPNRFPRGMIMNFAKVDADVTRQMFVDLYDETKDLQSRIESFMDTSEMLRSKYNPVGWKSHFQEPYEISVYLWLRYPEKYYIYRSSVYLTVAKKLGVDAISGKHKKIDKLISCFKLYDEIREGIEKRTDICDMVKEVILNNNEFYRDDSYRTLTTDFAYFVAKYLETKEENKTKSNVEYLMSLLKNQKEIIPDEHDGSYELMRETIEAYSKVEDLSVLDYTDMDLIYLMAIGTFRDGCEAKKNRVRENLHLSEESKQRLLNLLDGIWEKAALGQYSNKDIPKDEKDKNDVFFGMFGTGFYTFSKYANNDSWTKQIQAFIKMLIEIKDISDDEEIYKIAEPIVNYPTSGIQAGVASVILHCLKPYSFPIINGNEKMGDIFSDLGIPLKQKQLAETYIANCRNIKTFRDAHFSFKNYRVFDLVARNSIKFSHEEDDYQYFLTKEQWLEFLKEDKEKYSETFKMLCVMLENEGEASTGELAEKLGGSVGIYNSRGSNLGKRARKKYNLPEYFDKNGDKWEYIIPFKGYNNPDGFYVWVLRDELKEALEEIIDMQEESKDELKFDHNIILFGPPGTGKTYNTAYYAVAICENIPIDKVKEMEYADVIDKYNKLKEAGRIDFITFHQSYGYEEFIEGIRPIFDNAEETTGSDIKYEIKPGKFKEFCDNVLNQGVNKQDWKLNDYPTVWKVSLEKTGDNETRRECMDNNHIRIGWDEYGEEISLDAEFVNGGKSVLNAFYNKMKVGDIVVSCYSSETTDAIGIIVGDAEWKDEYPRLKRTRKVEWLVKGINENILKINNNKPMVLASVYKMDVNIEDILDIVRKYTKLPEKTLTKKNYVFIIDEINRGNISKIFGELITLIEESKRIGASEGMTLNLAYSTKPFGVPENVYIIGTMNTADRSIALMDTALRRRFRFIEMMPEIDVIKGVIIEDKGVKLDVSKMLDIINKRIECLFDREHTIGHAFFTSLKQKNEPTIEDLGEIFEKSVIPLLQEYFYEDYEKIRLVLGDNAKKDATIEFITCTKNDSKIFRGNVTEEDYNDYNYQINKKAFKNIMSYKGISEDL